MREVTVIGVGMHPWGKFPEKTVADMGAEAVRMALTDANMQWKDVQCLVSGIWAFGGSSGLNTGQNLAMMLGETGIPITNIYNMCATATSVFRTAYNTVASGEQDICVAVGFDKSPKGFFSTIGAPDDKDTEYLRWRILGLTNPGYWAIECRKRMEQFGTTERHLAKAKVACSKHAALNPHALWKKIFTEEEVLNSPMVCDPLRLYMICATRDGAAAAILCSAEKAKQFTSKPVKVAGVGLGSSVYGDETMRLGLLSTFAKGEAPLLSESAMSARMAFEKAGLGPEDIGFVELPDNSSWHYLQYLETIGFCKAGEAERLLDDGDTLLGGKIPVCPSGGASSTGEAIAAQGLAQICEVVWQLRGQAGARQVKDAKVGMSQTYGMLGNSAATILKI